MKMLQQVQGEHLSLLVIFSPLFLSFPLYVCVSFFFLVAQQECNNHIDHHCSKFGRSQEPLSFLALFFSFIFFSPFYLPLCGCVSLFSLLQVKKNLTIVLIFILSLGGMKSAPKLAYIFLVFSFTFFYVFPYLFLAC